MSNTIRRDLHPQQIKVIDPKAGTVEYVASSQALDSANEVISAKGWKFDRFQRNAPFVDSHNYDSIDCLLGRVIDYGVKGGNLVETVQWAIDVPQNTLAQKGFAMTQAGYLKAVSVGFIPTKMVTRNDSTGTWDEAVKDLGLGDLEDSINCIYLEQQQLELSACCLGANPDALAKAYKDGILEDCDLLRYPAMRRAVESSELNPRRSYSFASQSQSTHTFMHRKTFIDNFTSKISAVPSSSIKQAADSLESARRGQSEGELFRASAMVRYAMAKQRRVTVHERASEILSDRLVSRFLNALPRYLAGMHHPDNDLVKRSLTPGSGTFGATLLPIDVYASIWDLILLNGVWKELGVVSMSTMETRVAQATANPTAYMQSQTYIGQPITQDAALTGSDTTPIANTIAVLLAVSRELLQDEKANLSFYLLTRFSEALSGSLDFCCLQGTGADDLTNGKITGIWNDNAIATATAAQGNAAINQLDHADFINAVAAVSGSALQRGCKWIISTSFIAPLMLLLDPKAHGYLLKTPAETGDQTWRLCGFEVVWAAQAPSVQTPGSIIAAFGHLPSYLVAIREELEVMLRDGTGFSSNEQSFRAIGRAFAQTRASSGLAKLALANA